MNAPIHAEGDTMTEHMWGCPVDRHQQYGEPANPTCHCAIDERSRLERRIAEVEEIWESQAAVIRDHHATIVEQLGSIRQQSTRIGEIAASNFALRKARDEALESRAQAWDEGVQFGTVNRVAFPERANPYRASSDAGGDS